MKDLFKLQSRLKIYSGFLIVCFLWGSSWAAVKLGIERIPIFLSLGIRFLIASIVLGLYILFFRLKIPRGRIFWQLNLFLCLFSFTIPLVLIYWGQVRVNSGLAAILFATFPLWVAILSHFFLPDEKITIQRIIGILLGFFGIVIIFNNSFSLTNNAAILGMAGIITGAIIQASGMIVLRRFGSQIHPVMLNFWPMLLSSIIILIVSIFTEDYSKIVFDLKSIGSIAYLAIFCTAITFAIYFWLIKYVEAVILSLSAFITPVLSIFISIKIMDEEFSPAIYLGSCIVLIGIAAANLGDILNVYRLKNDNNK